MRRIVIIGCGAAGMAAAISAAENRKNPVQNLTFNSDKAGIGKNNTSKRSSFDDDDPRVTVLEKNDRPGKKIYITGKGRCNVTNACETSAFFDHVVRGKKFLYSAVYGYDSICVQRFFEENGCPLKTERGGRVFPVSDHSSDIIRTLVEKMKALGVVVRYGAEVRRLMFGERTGDLGVCSLRAETKTKSASEQNGDSEAKRESQTKKNETLDEFNEVDQNRKYVTGVQLTTGEIIEADAVIIATGGLSYPTTGSTGDGYKFAKAAGHEVEACSPSLVPFEVKESWCADVQGLSLKNVRLYTDTRSLKATAAVASTGSGKSSAASSAKKSAALKRASKKRLFDEQGEMLFTHFGISGPLVLSASSVYEEGSVLPLLLDLKPALTVEQLVARLERDFSERRDKQFKNALDGLFPRSLIPVMVRLAHGGAGLANRQSSQLQQVNAPNGHEQQGVGCMILPDEKVAGISPKQTEAFAKLIKAVPMTVVGTRSFREAVITRGGVNLKEIDPSTMQSKLCDGLYFAGEVIDADAVTGGYNLQIAWSTGHLAGESAACT